ncbi:hypothetical protein BDV18DRAFT_160505 [Aspergillus unguis]
MSVSPRSHHSMNIHAVLNPQNSEKPEPSVKQRHSPGPLTESNQKLHSSPASLSESKPKLYDLPPIKTQYSPEHHPPSPNNYSTYHYNNENQYPPGQSNHYRYQPYPYSQSHVQSPGHGISYSLSNPQLQDPFQAYRAPPHLGTSRRSSPEMYTRDRYSSISSSSTNGTGSLPSNHSNPNGYRHQSSSSQSHSGGPERLHGDRRRAPRPKYEEEEMYFIWYHRVDLGQEWREVRESFNRQFPQRQRAGFQGIQCKFYRFIKDKNVPTLREQRRMRDGEFLRQEGAAATPVLAGPNSVPVPLPLPSSSAGVEGGGGGGGGGGGSGGGNSDSRNGPSFGVVEWMGAWYPWMRESREEVARKRIRR